MGKMKYRCTICGKKMVARDGIPTCPDCGYKDPRSIRIAQLLAILNYVAASNRAPRSAGAAQTQYSGVSRPNIPAEPSKATRSARKPKRRILAAVCLFLVAGAIGLVVVFAKSNLRGTLDNFIHTFTDRKANNSSGEETADSDDSREAEEEKPSYRRPESDFLIKLLERVYAKPIDEVSYEELCGIVCLDFHYLDGANKDTIALDVWLSDGSWQSYFLNKPKIDMEDLACLEGLEELYLLGSYTYGGIHTDWHNLKRLQYLSCDITMEWLTKYMDVSQLVYLELKGAPGMWDLSAVSAYTSLECLVLDADTLTDITGLSQVPQLTALYIKSGDKIDDFSELYNMPQLEQLSIRSAGLNDIGFVSGMDNLRYLELEKTNVVDISALADCADTLTGLYLTDDYKIEDISPVMACTGLEELQLWVHSSRGEMPDFSAMENLWFLSISGYDSFDNLASLSGITELTLNRAFPEKNRLPLAELPNLRTLNMLDTSFSSNTVEELVGGLDQLQVLNLKNSFFWSDISPVFGLPNLVELNLEGATCGLMPDRLTVCENLTSLNLTKTVFHSLTEEGMWDRKNDDIKISTQEVLDVMAPCVPMLNTLYAPGQNLDDLSFTANLPELWMLDVTNNNISDLSPLTKLEWLNVLRCGGNPARNTDGLENVLIK